MTVTIIPSSLAGREGAAALNTAFAATAGDVASLASRRERLAQFSANAKPVAGVAISDELVAGVRTLRIVPVVSQGVEGNVLYLHGGAYVLGSADTHRWLAARYALATGATFHVVDYRLAPEHPYPAAINDAVAVWSSLATDCHWAMMGDSAGGGLALATAIACRDRDLPMPGVLALASPWLDLTLAGLSLTTNAGADARMSRVSLAVDADRYRGALPSSDPRISPLFDRLDRLPPTIVQVGGNEILFDDSVRLEQRMAQAGVACRLEIWNDMIHSWPAFGAAIPEGKQSIQSMGDQLALALAQNKPTGGGPHAH